MVEYGKWPPATPGKAMPGFTIFGAVFGLICNDDDQRARQFNPRHALLAALSCGPGQRRPVRYCSGNLLS